MKKFFKDFKAFITRGNIIDLAIGVVIGSAFSAIVNSLVNDIIMPLLTLATGDGVEGLSIVLNGVPKYLADGSLNPEAVLWKYGKFLQAIINFLIIAICLFLALKVVMKIRDTGNKLAEKQKKYIAERLKKGEISEEEAAKQEAQVVAEAPAAPVETTETLLKEIRDLLKAQQSDEATAKLDEVEKK